MKQLEHRDRWDLLDSEFDLHYTTLRCFNDTVRRAHGGDWPLFWFFGLYVGSL